MPSFSFVFRSALVLAGCFVSLVQLHAEPSSIESLIRVNQIGYLPDGNKVAVIADPQVGQNADLTFEAGATYQVRRWADDSVVFEGEPSIWEQGATHVQSGDRGWWFDFSAVTEAGFYYVWDVENQVGSYRFEISDTVYNEVLKVAMRTFYYQRLGQEKPAQYAGADWEDGASFVGPGQDTECRSVYDRDNPETERDLSGGWMDAGDYNKYVTFAEAPVHQLLHAWEERSDAFGDDYNLPESGNGIPDILDEVHYEMQWMAKMQEDDGGVLLKMGEIDYNGSTPPSSDARPRYYVPACSSSTIAAAGMYAHAALVFRQFSALQAFADQLETQAILAWEWYNAHEKSTNCDELIVKSGDADRNLAEQSRSALIAAMYLHRLTKDAEFGTYVDNHYQDSDVGLFGWSGDWVYRAPLSESALHYCASGLASDAVVTNVLQKKAGNESGTFVNWTIDDDLYRGYMPDGQYHWGSHNVRCNMANASMDFITFEINGADVVERRLRAENMLHYMLGVNPMGLVYLTRMEDFGAEESVEQFYHSWFHHGSEWDTNPPPGYVPGGPNASYSGDLEELQNVPVQKSFAQFNGGASNSWEVTENGIYYEAAFVKMLSKFVSEQSIEVDFDDDDGDGIANSMEDWLGLDRNVPNHLSERVHVEKTDIGHQLLVQKSASSSADRVSIEWSEDLVQWEAFAVNSGRILSEENGLRTEGFELDLPAVKRLFLRLVLQP